MKDFFSIYFWAIVMSSIVLCGFQARATSEPLNWVDSSPDDWDDGD